MTRSRWRMQLRDAWMVFLVLGGLVGCSDLTGHQPLPAGTNDPSFYHTPAGALGMRSAAVYAVEQAIPSVLVDAGLLTDELESNQTAASAGGVLNNPAPPAGGLLDARILPELSSGDGTNADGDYSRLQGVRGSANQALGALAAYDAAAPPALRGELFALKGYAEILLADFFCSGIPLSTLDFQSDFTYHAGSTTQQVYQDAVVQEDSALALSGANDTVQNLARVLKGRALLNLGGAANAAQAAQVVAAVPDGFQYRLAIQWNPHGQDLNLLNQYGTISDREGTTGLPFLSSGDPRVTDSTVQCPNSNSCPSLLTFPAKYSTAGYSPFTVADWIEARLIQAESAFQANPTDPGWLTLLNHLRETAQVPGQTATLSDTSDPGNNAARLSLLFHERAFWLFLTGHRQGDLRRLIRQYGQYGLTQDHVYPIGPYFAPGAGSYGNDVTAPIPSSEYRNPLFHGCLSRGA